MFNLLMRKFKKFLLIHNRIKDLDPRWTKKKNKRRTYPNNNCTRILS